MAGLNLRLMGGVNTSAGGFSTDTSSATAMAFGPGYSQAGMPSTASALKPNDPFGIAFWAGVASLLLLIVVRQSLPE